MSEQIQGPQPNMRSSHLKQYFIGLSVGVIPFILALITIGGIYGIGSQSSQSMITYYHNLSTLLNVLIVAVILYLGMWIASFVCLTIRRKRFIGYGLLTIVLVVLVVVLIAWAVRNSRIQASREIPDLIVYELHSIKGVKVL